MHGVAHVGRARRRDGLDELDADVAADAREQSRPAAEHHRRDREREFVDEPGAQVLLDGVGAAGDADVAIAGHRTTYLAPFRHINDVQDGDQIRLEMPYAAFTYTVEKHEVVDPGDVQIIKPVGYPRLVLTACHPLYSASHRWAVFAKLTRIDLFALTGAGRWPTP